MFFFSKIFPKSFFSTCWRGKIGTISPKSAGVFKKACTMQRWYGAHYARKTMEHNARILGAQSRRATPKLPTTICFPKLSDTGSASGSGHCCGWPKTFGLELKALTERLKSCCTSVQSSGGSTQISLQNEQVCPQGKDRFNTSVLVHAQGRWPEIVEWVAQPVAHGQ